MNKLARIKLLKTLFLSVGLGFSQFLLLLCLIQGVVVAAPPEAPLSPQESIGPLANLTITGTKTTTPINTINAGEALTYTIIFTTDIPADTVVVTDSVPGVFKLKTATITGTPVTSVTAATSGNVITWTVNNIAINSPVTLTFAVTVSTPISGGIAITNTAWLSGTTDTKVIDSAPVAINSAPVLQLQKTGPVSATVGSSIVYTIRYSNTGTMTATGIIVTDTLPSGVRVVSSSVQTDYQTSSYVRWDDPVTELPPDGTPHTILLTVTTNVTGTLINTAEIKSAQGIEDSDDHQTVVTTTNTPSQTSYLPIVLKNFRCAPDQYEPNNGGDPLEKAKAWQWNFGSGATITGNFCLDDDPSDYFWLDLNAGTRLQIWLYPPGTDDYDLYLYKGNTYQTRSANYGSTSEYIDYTAPTADTYFIRVYPFNKSQGDSYSLKITY